MKRNIWFIVMVLTILILLCGWAYLIVFGSPKAIQNATNGLLFSDFTQEEDAVPRGDRVTPLGEEAVTVDVASADFNQITTRPVAGYTATTTSEGRTVRYAERGTGHIFDISLDTGVETRISGITFTKVVEAKFSPDGTRVVLGVEDDSAISYVTGSIPHDPNGTLTTTPLPTGIENVTVTNGSITYTLSNENGLVGYRRNAGGNTTTVFSIPLRDARVLWSNTSTFTIPRTASSLKGALYSVNNGALVAQTPALYELSGIVNEAGTLFLGTYKEPRGKTSLTILWDLDTKETSPISLITIPEKCDFIGDTGHVLCAAAWAPLGETSNIIDWYNGTHTAIDQLWLVDTEEQLSTLVVKPETLLGFPIDITGLRVYEEEEVALMKNKTNDTLFIYYLDGTPGV